MKKKILLVVVLVVLGLTFVPITVPTPLKNKVLTNVETIIGRKVALGDIKYNVIRNILYLKDFKVYEKDEKNVFVGFDSFGINIDFFPLLYKKLNLSDIILKKPNIRLAYDNNEANYIDIINNVTKYIDENSDPDKIESEKDKNKKPFITTFKIDKIKVDSFTFRYKDKVVEGQNTLTITVPDLSYENDKLLANIDINFLKKGNINLVGEYDNLDRTFNGEIKINKLLLDDKLYLLKEINKIKTVNGSLDSDLKVSGDLNKNIYKIKGYFNGDKIKVVSMENGELLQLNKVAIDIKNIEPLQNIYDINKIDIEDGYSDTTNIISYVDLLTKNEKAVEAKEKLDKKIKVSEEKIKRIEKAKELNKVEDNSMEITNFLELAINELNIKNIELKNEERDLKFNLKGHNIGTSKGTSKFIIDSTLNGQKALDLKLDLDKLNNIKSTKDLKKVKGTIEVKKFPLSMLNYFFKDGQSKLKGYLDIDSKLDYTDDYIYTKNKFSITDLSVVEDDLNLQLTSLVSNNDIAVSQVKPGEFTLKGSLDSTNIIYDSAEAKGNIQELNIGINQITPTIVNLSLIDIKNPNIIIDELKAEKSEKTKKEIKKSLTTYVYNFFKHLFIKKEDKREIKKSHNNKNNNDIASEIPIILDIDKVVLLNGELKFTYPKLNIDVNRIKINSNNFTSRKNKKFDLYVHSELKSGGVITANAKAHLKNDWDFQPTSLNVEGKVDVGNLNLRLFRTLLADSIPNYLENGKLFYNSKIKINNSKFTSTNHIDIKKLDLGDRTKVKSVVPVKLAIKLLKDSSGNIVVDIPVSGDFSNPKFNVYKVLLGQVRNLLLKVTNSPFTIMKSVFNLKEGEVKKLNYKLLSIEPKDKEDLEKITDLLSSSDKLKAIFTLTTNINSESYEYSRRNPNSTKLSKDVIKELLNKRKKYLENYFRKKGVLNSITINTSDKNTKAPTTTIKFNF